MTFGDDIPIFKKDPTDTEFTDGKAVFISVLSIINVFMLLGNTLSIITITTNKSLRNQVSYWFVLNLAIIDFIIAVTVVPLNTMWEYYGTWPLSPTACEIFTFADISFSTISAYSIVLVSIDKYVYITYPMKYHDKMTKKVTLFLIIAVWIMVFVFTTVSVTTDVGTEEEYRNHLYSIPNSTEICIFVMTDEYVVPSAIICFFIPFSILCFTSTKIVCIASNHIRKIHQLSLCIPSDTNSDIQRTSSLKLKYKPQKLEAIQKSKSLNVYKTSAEPTKPERKENEEYCDKEDCSAFQMNSSVTQQVDFQDNAAGVTNPTFSPDVEIDCTSRTENIQRDRTMSIVDETKQNCDRETEKTHGSDKLTKVVSHKQDRFVSSSETNILKQTCLRNTVKKDILKQTESIKTLSPKKYPYCKLFGTITIVVACFMVMFSPYYIATMVDVVCHCVEPWVYEDVLSVLYYMHSLVNPYIYMSTDRKYKAALKLLYLKVKTKFTSNK